MSKTIIVAQGMCSPIRAKVLTLFEPYGFKDLSVKSYSVSPTGYGQDGATFAKGSRVLWNVAEVTVSDAAARWAEYLICRSKQYRLMSKPIDPRNEAWAAKWDTLPKAWTQPGCKPPANTQPQRREPSNSGGLFDGLVRLFAAPPPVQRKRDRPRRERTQRHTRGGR